VAIATRNQQTRPAQRSGKPADRLVDAREFPDDRRIDLNSLFGGREWGEA
jgi:hypothetical protein